MLEVSAAIITDGKSILCFQKGIAKRSYLSYKYEFPGGKLEEGETPKQALIRELGEELEFYVNESDIRPFRDLVHKYPDFSVLIHYLIVSSKNPQYKLKEHISATWTLPSEITKLDWAGADAEAAKILENEGHE